MVRRPPRSTRTETLFPYTTLFRSQTRGALHHRAFADRIREIAERFGFTLDPDAVVGELSVGERQRAEIVKCLMREPRLLVLDEPTAVLPPGEIGALLDIRSEERRVGKECGSTCRSGCQPSPSKTNASTPDTILYV